MLSLVGSEFCWVPVCMCRSEDRLLGLLEALLLPGALQGSNFRLVGLVAGTFTLGPSDHPIGAFEPLTSWPS